jgi:hypothetical protein
VRQLKICGREYDAAQQAAVFDDAGSHAYERHLALRRRWRKVGNIMLGIGVIGTIGSVVAIVAASMAMQDQPQPTDLSQVSPEQLRASVIMTVALIFAPMLILIGILVRQKQ